MRIRFLSFVLACLFVGFSAPAFAQKTKDQLTTEINQNFPNNSVGAITPANTRTTLTDMVNSWVQLGSNSISGAKSLTWTDPDFIGNWSLNNITVPSDNATNAGCPSACGGMTDLFINHTVSGSGTGPRFGIWSNIAVTGTPGDKGSGIAAGYWQPVYFTSYASASAGGTDTGLLTSYGNIFGGGVLTELRNGATNWHAQVGWEIDVNSQTGSSVSTKVGLLIPGYAETIGTHFDSAIAVSGSNGWSKTWMMGLSFGNAAGGFGVDRCGTLIGKQDGTDTLSSCGITPFTVAYGIDFNGFTFTQSPFRIPNTATIVAANAAGNANIPLISTGSDNTVHIAPSYGGGIFIGGPFAPETNGTLSLGDALNNWSNAFTLTLTLTGSSSGALAVKAPSAAGSNTLTLPAGTTDFSSTGGASQVVKQTSSGGAFTVGQLGVADISGLGTAVATALGNTAGGSGGVAVIGSPASFTNLVGTTNLAVGAASAASGAIAWIHSGTNDNIQIASIGGANTGTAIASINDAQSAFEPLSLDATTLNLAVSTLQVNGTSGVSQTCTVNQAKTLVFTLGVLTGGTCNT